MCIKQKLVVNQAVSIYKSILKMLYLLKETNKKIILNHFLRHMFLILCKTDFFGSYKINLNLMSII